MTALVVVLLALAPGALREPPAKVKFHAEKQGDVTFDHPVHLALRERCKTCHGDGPIQKMQMDKRRGHSLCFGCHVRKKRGPTACNGCHEE